MDYDRDSKASDPVIAGVQNAASELEFGTPISVLFLLDLPLPAGTIPELIPNPGWLKPQTLFSKPYRAEVKIRQSCKAGSLLKGLTVSQQAGKPRVRYNTSEPLQAGDRHPAYDLEPSPTAICNYRPAPGRVSRLMEIRFQTRQRQAVELWAKCSVPRNPGNTTGSMSIQRLGNPSRTGLIVETRKNFDGWFARMHKRLRDGMTLSLNYDGKMLFRQYERMYFHNVKPGSDGRIRALSFLREVD